MYHLLCLIEKNLKDLVDLGLIAYYAHSITGMYSGLDQSLRPCPLEDFVTPETIIDAIQ